MLNDVLCNRFRIVQITVYDFGARLLDLFAMIFPSDKSRHGVSCSYEQVEDVPADEAGTDDEHLFARHRASVVVVGQRDQCWSMARSSSGRLLCNVHIQDARQWGTHHIIEGPAQASRLPQLRNATMGVDHNASAKGRSVAVRHKEQGQMRIAAHPSYSVGVIVRRPIQCRAAPLADNRHQCRQLALHASLTR